MGVAGAGSSGGSERNAWEAASLVCRIATVGLSLASAIMTAASTRCVYRKDGSPAGSVVSYSNYGSFKYSAIANLVSAVLQGVAIWLEVVGKERWAKTVGLIDKLVLALTSTSAPLLFAVDDITSCGGGRRGSRSRSSVCDQAGSLCRQLRFASLPSLATVGFSAAADYASRRAAVTDSSAVAQRTTRRARPPPAGPGTVVVRAPLQGGGAGGGSHAGGVGNDSVPDENPRDNGNNGGEGGDEQGGGGVGGGHDECQVIDEAHQGSPNTAREGEIEAEDRGDGTGVEEEDGRSAAQPGPGEIVTVRRRWPFGWLDGFLGRRTSVY